ncbi:hypothetical protein QJQ45_000603 [Haematococcus lacustris]|nr:hypothetical protein QJQ45_000603 [Haematococcus lacustris]
MLVIASAASPSCGHQALKTNENPARVGRLEDFPCSLEQYCDRGEDLLGLNAHFHNWLQGSPHYPITMVRYESLWDPAVALELLRRCCSHKADMHQVQIWTQEWCQARRQRTSQTAVVEICIDSVASAEHARQGGAQRVELCANLHEGGVTPSAGMIKMVRQAFPPPGQLMVLIRCRGGDFLYSPEELLVMQEDIEVCSQLGADGVVLGCLTATGEVDSDATATLMRTALIKGLQVTFHRAFDLCRDMSAALQQLVRLGVQRVLTSGGKPSALAVSEAVK